MRPIPFCFTPACQQAGLSIGTLQKPDRIHVQLSYGKISGLCLFQKSVPITKVVFLVLEEFNSNSGFTQIHPVVD